LPAPLMKLGVPSDDRERWDGFEGACRYHDYGKQAIDDMITQLTAMKQGEMGHF